jgi:hypothetical protein
MAAVVLDSRSREVAKWEVCSKGSGEVQRMKMKSRENDDRNEGSSEYEWKRISLHGAEEARIRD